ncbi:MAG: PfkB family carbohydrate kinase [Anaerolineae bacterium]
MKGKIVCLGEIMLRLSPPRLERLFQSPVLDTTFGGGEANTAASLAQFEIDVSFVTALPANPIGDACVRFLRSFGVNTSQIQRSGDRIGIYYLESGANQRPTQVVYDRSNSAIADADPSSFDWDEIFADASWLHVTGITPAISQTAADLTLAACAAASDKGMMISVDTSHRAKLWQYGVAPQEIMPKIAQFANILFANLHDCAFSYGVDLDESVKVGKGEDELNRLIGAKMFETFPSLKYQVFTHREGFSASHNAWAASVFDGQKIVRSPRYDMTHIVDRVGGGDAFAAGLIYGFHKGMGTQKALDFGAAAACLKHSVPGDVNYATVAEVEQLMGGDGSGRVQR